MNGNDELKNLGWKVPYSILISVGWLIFLIIWLFFYADGYNWEKNVAIFILSVFILALILGTPWVIWGMKYRTKNEKIMWQTKGFKWRLWLSLILAFFLIIFLIVWFWYYAEPYTWYQNIAILIVSVLIIGGVLGASWAPWGMKYGHKFDEPDEKQKEKTQEKSIENEIDEELKKSKK